MCCGFFGVPLLHVLHTGRETWDGEGGRREGNYERPGLAAAWNWDVTGASSESWEHFTVFPFKRKEQEMLRFLMFCFWLFVFFFFFPKFLKPYLFFFFLNCAIVFHSL